MHGRRRRGARAETFVSFSAAGCPLGPHATGSGQLAGGRVSFRRHSSCLAPQSLPEETFRASAPPELCSPVVPLSSSPLERGLLPSLWRGEIFFNAITLLQFVPSWRARVEVVVGGFCRDGGDWSYTGFAGEEYHYAVPNVRTIDGVTPLDILRRLSSHSVQRRKLNFLKAKIVYHEIAGLLVPSCPESFQFFEEQGRGHGQGQRKPPSTDQHQKIFDFHRGDIIAVPSGFVHWCYNNGDRSLVTLRDTNNSTNQLDSTINISCWPKAAKTQKGET
ncbi:Legumin type B [Platanthera guangdongensis]|uniref:Legumin type B n=1 Tax=Platanthera guangdongensis TaxID=2320717 RepID=A0ABR2M9C7_9ASPA